MAFKGRDPEVQALLVESLKLIARAEGLYEQLTEHQMEMAGFLRRAQDFVDTEDSKDEHDRG